MLNNLSPLIIGVFITLAVIIGIAMMNKKNKTVVVGGGNRKKDMDDMENMESYPQMSGYGMKDDPSGPECGEGGDMSNCLHPEEPRVYGENNSIYAIYEDTIHAPNVTRSCAYRPPLLSEFCKEPYSHPAGCSCGNLYAESRALSSVSDKGLLDYYDDGKYGVGEHIRGPKAGWMTVL